MGRGRGGAPQEFGVIQPTEVELFRPAASGRPTPSKIMPTNGRRRATTGAKRLKSPSLLGKCLPIIWDAPWPRRGASYNFGKSLCHQKFGHAGSIYKTTPGEPGF